jgi:hypothetical protein
VWVLRALARLAVQIGIATAVALALAAVQAPFRRDSFVDGLVVSLYLVGGFLLVLGAVGGSSLGRVADASARQEAWGRVPGLPAWAERREGEPVPSASAVLVATGIALVSLAVLLSQ